MVHPINGMPEHVACIMDGNGRWASRQLVLIDVLWPDFGGEHLRDAVEVYRSRQRRFGAV